MHRILRTALVPLMFTTLTLAGCKASSRKNKASATGGLSREEFAKLRSINDAQSSALDTVRKLSEDKSRRCGVNERRHVEPVVQSSEWSTHDKLAGDDKCPVQYLKEWNFDPAQQKLSFRHELKTSRESRMTYRRATGSITREGDARNRTMVGAIHYDRIEIAGFGFVDVEIQTNQKYTKVKGLGEANVTVKQGDWSHVGTMRWKTGRTDKTIYEVDGHSITEAGFNQLFSAYGLPEIMANSMKMR